MGTPSSTPTPRATLVRLMAELASMDRDLRHLADSLPNPRFEAGTDKPLNAAASLLGLLEATRHDEIQAALQAMETGLGFAAQIMAEAQAETDTALPEESP